MVQQGINASLLTGLGAALLYGLVGSDSMQVLLGANALLQMLLLPDACAAADGDCYLG